MKPFFHSLMLLCLVGSAWVGTDAQTVRVRCGSGGGCVTYREVYEFDYVSEKPRFPGGQEKMICFINRTRNYPAEAYRKGVEGRVTVSFVVNCDGRISDISVLRGVEASLNAEAMRVISAMPVWTPGRINGRNVPVRVVQTVPFRR